MDYENYSTVNKTPDAPEKNWCISARHTKKVQQVKVKLNNGRSYDYACRFPVEVGDVAVIGADYLYGNCNASNCNSGGASTGQMGIVTEVLPRLMIKKDHALELDYVFKSDFKKKTVTDCGKYLEMPLDMTTVLYANTDERRNADYVYAISSRIRMLLAAASILANLKTAAAGDEEKAKAYIASRQSLTKGMLDILQIGVANAAAYISTDDIHINLEGRNEEELQTPEIQRFLEIRGDILTRASEDELFTAPQGINDYINKYSYIGAVSIMVRGGFLNLLKAFLEAKPPVKDFWDELLADMGETGDPACLKLLRSCDASDFG